MRLQNLRSFSDISQSQSSRQCRLTIYLDSPTVILDFKRCLITFLNELDPYFTGVRMFDNVVQTFLNNPPDIGFVVRREKSVQIFNLQV